MLNFKPQKYKTYQEKIRDVSHFILSLCSLVLILDHPINSRRYVKMRRSIIDAFMAVLFVGLFAGCQIQGNLMSQSEKLFIKMVNKTAGKLDLSEHQKVQLEQLKMDIGKNFLEGQREKEEATARIKEEGTKENPDTQRVSFLLQGLLRNEMERMNRRFDLILNFQSNLNDIQKKKLIQMKSKWVTED